MKAHWIIERDVFDPGYTRTMAARLREAERGVSFIDVIAGEVDGRMPRPEGPVVLYGGIGIDKIGERYGWTPGVFASPERFQSSVYAEALGSDALNADAVRVPLSEAEQTARSMGLETVFLKPNDDNKAFAGLVKSVDEIAPWVERLLDTGYLDSIDFDVILSAPKPIEREWRCVIVEGVLRTASQYRHRGERILEAGAPQAVGAFISDLHTRFAPAPVYMLDIAQTDEGLKVVEYNTFNTAEFYACDVEQIVDAVSAFVERG